MKSPQEWAASQELGSLRQGFFTYGEVGFGPSLGECPNFCPPGPRAPKIFNFYQVFLGRLTNGGRRGFWSFFWHRGGSPAIFFIRIQRQSHE